MTSLVLVIIAAISNAVMDKIQFHYGKSIFPKDAEGMLFWKPQLSWRNKWKDGYPEHGADELQETYKFHASILRKGLRINTKKLNIFLTYLQDKSKIYYTYTEHKYLVKFPNLSKYLGRYPRKVDKVKESKVKKSKVNVNDIVNMVSALGRDGFEQAKIELGDELYKKIVGDQGWSFLCGVDEKFIHHTIRQRLNGD